MTTIAYRVCVLTVLVLAFVSLAVASFPSPAIAAASAAVFQIAPPACAAERRTAERAGVDMADVNAEVAASATANRARALRVIENLSVAPSATERDRVYNAYLKCAHQARLAQLGPAPPPVTIVSTTPDERSVTGSIAWRLGLDWAGATVVRPSAVTPSLDAIAALEAGPADGSRILLIPIPLPTAANARQIVDALAPLRRISLVAGPPRANATNSGVALFAPSRTPAARVTQLIAQSAEAMSDMAFPSQLQAVNVAPPTGDIAATLLSVLSRLPAAAPAPAPATRGAAAPAPARAAAVPAPAPPSARAATANQQWPLGIAPGNLYVIQQCVSGFCGGVLVSGTSPQDAVGVANLVGASDLAIRQQTASYSVLLECRGPGWGATISLGTGGGFAQGHACGASTPAAALLAAGAECAKKNQNRPCVQTSPRSMTITVGHSGESHPGYYTPVWLTSQLWAYAGRLSPNGLQPVNSAEDAIAKLGQVCSDGANMIPCFTTSRNFQCLDVDAQYRGAACVDTTYTATGVEPFVTPNARR
jgi:hypothetical protein